MGGRVARMKTPSPESDAAPGLQLARDPRVLSGLGVCLFSLLKPAALLFIN